MFKHGEVVIGMAGVLDSILAFRDAYTCITPGAPDTLAELGRVVAAVEADLPQSEEKDKEGPDWEILVGFSGALYWVLPRSGSVARLEGHIASIGQAEMAEGALRGFSADDRCKPPSMINKALAIQARFGSYCQGPFRVETV